MPTRCIKAKLENDILNVYNEEKDLIGGIKTQSNFKNTEIKIGENKYEISNDKVSELEILTTLYGHLYGSNMKLKAVIIGAVIVGIISSGIINYFE